MSFSMSNCNLMKGVLYSCVNSGFAAKSLRAHSFISSQLGRSPRPKHQDRFIARKASCVSEERYLHLFHSGIPSVRCRSFIIRETLCSRWTWTLSGTAASVKQMCSGVCLIFCVAYAQSIFITVSASADSPLSSVQCSIWAYLIGTLWAGLQLHLDKLVGLGF